MLAELLANSGIRILGNLPPNGKKFWAERFWDRAEAEQDPLLSKYYLEEKEDLLGLIKRYAADSERLLEICCGSGEFLQFVLDLTDVKELVGVDVSPHALKRAADAVQHDGLHLIEGDFWDDGLRLGTADFVLCVDSLQHLGNTREVLERFRSFLRPGGVFIGNVWTLDNFHELELRRYGRKEHLIRSAKFFGSAVAIRASFGRLRSDSYRTKLARQSEFEATVRDVFPKVHEVTHHRYHTSFACEI